MNQAERHSPSPLAQEEKPPMPHALTTIITLTTLAASRRDTSMSIWRTLIIFVVVLAASACQGPSDTQRAPTQTSPTSSAQAAGRCEHGLPPALCPKCNPALAAVFQAKGDWCEAHGFPESFCPVCNPNARIPDVGEAPPAAADWCVEHALPESKCTKCNPSLIPKFQAAGDWCA